MFFKTLKTRMIVHVIWIVASVAAVTFYAVYRLHVGALEEHLKADAIAASEMVDNLLISVMKRNESDLAREILPELSRLHHLNQVRIVDIDGRIAFSSDREEEGTKIESESFQEFVREQAASRIVQFSEDRSLTFERWHKLENAEVCQNCHDPARKVNGVSWISTSDSVSIAALKWDLVGVLGIAIGVIVLLSVATEVLFIHSVDRPVQELRRTMTALQKGDFSARAQTTQDDDLGQLGRGLNAMAQRLERAKGHLMEHHREELMQAEALAKIGEMAAGMAHEIKNPISGIVFAANSLMRETDPEDERHDIFEEIVKQANRVEQNLESLLTFARHSRLERFPTELNNIIERILLFVHQQPDMRRIEISSDLDKSLPEVLVDPKQIEQVILNLVINAVQAMPDGGILTIISRLGEQSGESKVELVVQDTGVGVPAEMGDEIFRPFMTTKVNGVGLGLALCQEIIVRHGGKIYFDSNPEKGTTFTIELPVGTLL